jgi:hypothetical protein
MNSGSHLAMNDQPAVPWLELEEQLRIETPKQWLQRLTAANTNEFNMLQIVLARFATNTQIRRVLTRLDKANNAVSSRKWKQTFRRLAPSVFKSKTRYRLIELDSTDYFFLHYTAVTGVSKEALPKRRPTIVGFTGSAGLLMAPISCVLAVLGQVEYDLIVVRRKYRWSYFEREGRLLLSIANDLLKILGEEIDATVTLGTSNGGLAAIHMAHMLRCSLGIALGAGATPLMLSDEGTLSMSMKRLNYIHQKTGLKIPKTKLLLAASGEHAGDKASALLISNFYNTVHQASADATAILFPECKNHGLPEDLSNMGFPLEKLLIPLVKQDLSDLPKHARHRHS